eukprot:TRINITY_DN61301_c0_g1_i1.p1 TRINITY_DN61301_c0_g1~~TRINITY_DN61301_c0_g1_i1.p1  ORF type:complete len:242 (+),score=39.01 TRINITY_DN61301_c0_g1_i1:141-866(+)
MNFEVISSTVQYESPAFKVQVDDIFYVDAARPGKLETVVRNDFVMVVPVADDGAVICVRRSCPTFRDKTFTFPSSVRTDESPEVVARRVLAETTGLQAGRCVKVAQLRESPEFAYSVGHVYVAEGLRPPKGGSEDSHARQISNDSCAPAECEVLRLDEKELRRLVRTGQMQSSSAVAAVHLLLDFVDRRRLCKDTKDAPLTLCPLPWLLAGGFSRGQQVAAFLVSATLFVMCRRFWRRKFF